jgi:hypothetical protein
MMAHMQRAAVGAGFCRYRAAARDGIFNEAKGKGAFDF